MAQGLCTLRQKGNLVRSAENESHVEVKFECLAGFNRRLESGGLDHYRVEVHEGELLRIAPGAVLIPAGTHAIAINGSGALLIRSATNPKLIVVPPRSITYLKGRLRLAVVAARGEHRTEIISWESELTPLLEEWLSSRLPTKQGHTGARHIACKPVHPFFVGAVDRLEEARNAGEISELMMTSAIYETVGRLMQGPDQVQLAIVPEDLPEALRGLTERVRAQPAQPWPLKNAADMAGYSAFHFSRVFKQIMGFGFHEFVDRCRTECAIDILITTDLAVDVVATSCGFGTPQALRESIKEYVGLVPSELRSLPAAFALSND